MGEPSPLLAKVLPAPRTHFTALDARAAGGFPRDDDMREAYTRPAILPTVISPGYSPLRIPLAPKAKGGALCAPAGV